MEDGPAGTDPVLLLRLVPGAGHFIQEDRGPELAHIVADFVARTA